MTDITLHAARDILGDRLPALIKGTLRLNFKDLGSIWVSKEGARIDDSAAEADTTFTASPEVFRDIFEGRQNPAMAAMTGKLKFEGSATRALKIASLLAD